QGPALPPDLGDGTLALAGDVLPGTLDHPGRFLLGPGLQIAPDPFGRPAGLLQDSARLLPGRRELLAVVGQEARGFLSIVLGELDVPPDLLRAFLERRRSPGEREPGQEHDNEDERN